MEVQADEVGVFVDTSSKITYRLLQRTEYIVSDGSLETSGNKVLEIPPAVPGESYRVQVTGNPPTLNLVHGRCGVNGKPISQDSPLVPGMLVTFGSARCVQYTCGGVSGAPPARRVLPPTPGTAVDPLPPSKPRRHKQQQQQCPPLIRSESQLTTDTGIRPRLQRIAAEVSARLVGYGDRKPPPPYERVGNSIGYQLLHQQQRKMVSSSLIDALYPALKENELKDSSLVDTYNSYLKTFQQYLEQPASVECMLPADLPTCDFVVDMLLHLCCMPHMTGLAEKQADLWCQLLALFSQSRQNQLHMASKRHATKVLSCMHLNIMAAKVRFQEYGWIVLSNTVALPTPPGEKPVLSESSLTLALSMTETQIATCSTDLCLVVAIVNFLSCVASTAKATVSNNTKENTYTEEQAYHILKLFQEHYVLRHVMKVPPQLRAESSFEQAYSSLVKALVPVRGQSSGCSPSAPHTTKVKTVMQCSNTGKQTTPAPVLGTEEKQVTAVVNIPAQVDSGLASAPAQNNVSDLNVGTTPQGISEESSSLTIDTDPSTPAESCTNNNSKGANSNSISQETVQSTNSVDECFTSSPPSKNTPPSAPSPHNTPPSPPFTHNTPPSPPSPHNTPPSPPSPPSTHNTPPSPPSTHNTPPSPPSTHNTPPSPPSTHNTPPSPPSTHNTPPSTHNTPPSPPSTHNTPPSPPSTHNTPPSPPSTHNTPPSPPSTHNTPPSTHNTPPSPPSTHNTPPSPPSTHNIPPSPPFPHNAPPSTHNTPPSTHNTPPSPHNTPPPPSFEDTTSPCQSDPSSSVPSTTSPPLTPNTANLAADVKELLDTLHTPLQPVIPTLSRYNRYYRHSYKKSSMKQKGRRLITNSGSDQGMADTDRLSQDTDRLSQNTDRLSQDTDRLSQDTDRQSQDTGRLSQDTDQLSSSGTRLLWGEGTTLSHEAHDMFEVSGQYLSTQHSALEEVVTGHGDVVEDLRSRVELLEGVLTLWAKGKGLQATTNLLQGCFSESCVNDVQLFVDCLHCFISFQSPWTLAICLVLLPTLRQLILSQINDNNVKVLGDTVLMIVDRFSELILAYKASSKRKSRLSSTVDKQQQIVCYKELHSLQQELHNYLNTNKVPVNIASRLRKVHTALKPFRQQCTA